MTKPGERCPHPNPPKRVCDLCESEGRTFLACSLACLNEHIASAHDWPNPEPSAERALAQIRAQHQQLPEDWHGDAGHRDEITARVRELPAGGELCVLGVGNGNELDLEQLASRFDAVHLVDLDEEALERARDRQSAAVRARIVLHESLDLSGVLQHLDEWGDRFPERSLLADRALAAAQGIVREIGRSFAVVVSNAVLGQLPVPFQRAWLTSRANWGELLSTLTTIHLGTLAGSTRPGGHALLVTDVASSRENPVFTEWRASRADLSAKLAAARAGDDLVWRRDPEGLMQKLGAAGLRGMVAELRLGAPWLWPRDAETQLVYALAFRHPLG